MKPLKITIVATCLFISSFLILGCDNRGQTDKNWYKGNLHTHSYWSDGDEFPEMIMDWYKSRDYAFVALSDHNILAEVEKWITIRPDSIYQTAFQNYLDEYGEDWVEYRENNDTIRVKLKTFEEYKPLFEEEEHFLIMPSEEISDQYDGKPLHMNVTNIQKLIKPQGGTSILEVLQNNIDAVLKQREETGVPMMVHINHPNFHYAISLDVMTRLKGERFFEVYNGHPQVHNLGDSLHLGTEEMWDFINIAYLEKGQPLIYGLATDDSHHYHRKGSQFSNAGRGWVMVQADSLSPAALIEAMENGHFYSSTGVTLKDLSFIDNKISIAVEPSLGVDYSIAFIGCKNGQKEATILQESEGVNAEFTLSSDINFVRAKITSTKKHPNPVENMIYEMAWTQPVVFNDEL